MKNATTRTATVILAFSAIVGFAACHKAKVVSTPAPPPPPPAAPTASLTAEPQSIEKGQSTTLTWQTGNANQISIDATSVITEFLGTLEPIGSQQVSPSESTTYTLHAKGPGGTESASVRVTVTVPAQPAVLPAQPNDEELFKENVRDVYFDFDNAEIRSDQQGAILADAAFLTQHPAIAFAIEGHCDERGSIEYNLALGDERATSVKQALVAAGVNSANITTVSYGKEKPVCSEQDEECWSQNRRGHFDHGK